MYGQTSTNPRVISPGGIEIGRLEAILNRREFRTHAHVSLPRRVRPVALLFACPVGPFERPVKAYGNPVSTMTLTFAEASRNAALGAPSGQWTATGSD
jgi:hypothetical protein